MASLAESHWVASRISWAFSTSRSSIAKTFSIYRDIAVKDLLKDLRIGDKSFIVRNASFEKTLSVNFVRVLGADQEHGYVGVDEDHFAFSER
jgi:hypothetical protein